MRKSPEASTREIHGCTAMEGGTPAASAPIPRGPPLRTVLRVIAAALVAAFASGASATPNWYSGKVTRIWSFGPTAFIVTLDSSALDDCQWKYAYFIQGSGLESDYKVAYATALAAHLTGRTVGIVIDKDKKGPTGQCNAISLDIRN